MKNEGEEYWSQRAEKEYIYKGEKFYTITAIPYYVKRRKIIIDSLMQLIRKYNVARIADIGCGDGEYLNIIHEEDKEYCGVDISEGMLQLAKQRCDNYKNVCFECSAEGTKKFDNYDMAYIVAMLAHVDDETMKKLLSNIYQKISRGGVLCICEQIAPNEIQGNGWKRRTFEGYVEALRDASFEVDLTESFRIDFRVHRKIFERHLAKKFYEKKSRTECNKDKWYLTLSAICTALSIRRKWKKPLSGWGYAFIVARKK